MGRPNVLLVVLDCVRAANTSLLGHRRKTTPFLEEFAREATVYTQARTTASWSLPAHTSLFTGVPSEGHKLQITERLEPGQTIFDFLDGEGYETGVFTENPYLTVHPSGLSDSFKSVVTERPDSTDVDDPSETRNGVDGFWYADRLTEWIDEQSESWAACLNLMDAHMPYATRDAYDEWGTDFYWAMHDELPIKWEWSVYGEQLPAGIGQLLEPLYDGAIRQTDAVLEQVIGALETRGVLDETLVVITSDHGDGFGEPPQAATEPPAIMHGMGTQEELFHVPLVVRGPGQTEGRRIESLATLSRFPDAVLAAFDGDEDDSGWFVAPDGQTTAYQTPPTGQTAEYAEEYTDEPDRFRQPASLVYLDGPGDTVYKRAAWGEDEYEAVVRGRRSEPSDGTPIDRSPSDVVADSAAHSETLEITQLASGEDEMAEYDIDGFDDVDLKSRLERLGYL
ncbi:sulfatase [Haloarcula argentinensis]|uniref:Sulfatase-like hydrolase/transferase n=1 Tax=Haloarcula argentinensis TaxID=43776 RepID=A0A847UHS9_HALAR|nr:sulfatase [Haloarcula argentinensis]NLV15343.1 sulfatase-like hydrolase/transferase [Haloarcula argentinensis]